MYMTQELANKLRYYRDDIVDGINEILEYDEGEELPQKELESLVLALEVVDLRMSDTLYVM